MRILVFGDSIAYGIWDEQGGWANRLRQEFDKPYFDNPDSDTHSIYNVAIGGDSSDDLTGRLESEIQARDRYGQLALVIAIGVNDSRDKAGMHYSDTERFRVNLDKIHEVAKRFTDRILFIGLTPVSDVITNPVPWGDTAYQSERIEQFNETLVTFCHQNGLPFVEMFQPFQNKMHTTEMLSDGLHPNTVGHAFMYERILPKVQELLA